MNRLSSQSYSFELSYPIENTADSVYHASDLRRAIEAYKAFLPTVATEAVIQQMLNEGAKPNDLGLVMATSPSKH